MAATGPRHDKPPPDATQIDAALAALREMEFHHYSPAIKRLVDVIEAMDLEPVSDRYDAVTIMADVGGQHPVNKVVGVENGAPYKHPVGFLSVYIAIIVPVANHEVMRRVLQGVSEHEWLTLQVGIAKHIPHLRPMLYVGALSNEHANTYQPGRVYMPDSSMPILRRTADNMALGNWIYFDRDRLPEHLRETLTDPREWWRAVGEALPPARSALALIAPSTTGRVTRPNGEALFSDVLGLHAWVKLANGPHDQDAVGVFRTQCEDLTTLAGLGERVKTQGTVREGHRYDGIMDFAVISPERPCFDGKPTVRGNLRVLPQKLELIDPTEDGNGGAFDVATLPKITPTEKKNIRADRRARHRLAGAELALGNAHDTDWLSPKVRQALARIGDHDGGLGLHNGAQSAFAVAVHYHGQDVDRERLLNTVASIVSERGSSRPKQELEDRLNKLSEQLDWTLRRDAESMGAPLKPMPTKSADEVRADMRAALERVFFNPLPVPKSIRRRKGRKGKKAQTPGRYAIRTTPGVGKTNADFIVRLARVLRKQIVVRVGFRDLGDQQAQRFLAELRGADDLVVGLWLGITQPDPNNPGCLMCPRAADLDYVGGAGGDLAAMCGSIPKGYDRGDPDVRRKFLCFNHPDHPDCIRACGYKQQDTRHMDILVVLGDPILTQAPHDRMLRDNERVGLLVLDETTPLNMLERGMDVDTGAMDPRIAIRVLLSDRVNPDNAIYAKPRDVEKAADDLRALHDVLENAQEDAGFVSVGDLLDRRWRSRLSNIISVCWDLKMRPDREDNVPQLTGDALKARLKEKMLWNMPLIKIIHIARALQQGLEDLEQDDRINRPLPHCEISLGRDDDGQKIMASVMYRATLHECWRNSDVLALDATLDLSLMEPWFPGMRMIFDEDAALPPLPAAKVVQIDAPISVSAYVPSSGGKAAEKRRAERYRARLGVFLRLRAADGPTSVVMPKKVGAKVKPPEDVIVGTYGSMRGLNAMENTRHHIAVGRLALNVRDAERVASVLAGRYVKQVPADGARRVMPEYTPMPTVYRDGTRQHGQVEHHPDPVVESVRWQISEAERIQALGRARGINRTDDNPVTITWLGWTSLAGDPMPIDEHYSRDDYVAATEWIGVALLMGIWPDSRGASQIFGLFGRPNAVQAKVLKGGESLLKYNNRDSPPLSTPKTRKAWYREQLRNHSGNDDTLNQARADLIHRVTTAMKANAPHVDILGAPFPLSAFEPHTVQLKHSGAKRATNVKVWLTPEGLTLLQALEPDAVIQPGHMRKRKR